MTHAQLPGIEIDDNWTILEVGRGPNKLFERSVTLDIYAGCHPNIVHNLNETPYPL